MLICWSWYTKELETEIHRYAKANNEYMKNCERNKESSYIQYLDASNLYGWEISQELPADGLKWKKIC